MKNIIFKFLLLIISLPAYCQDIPMPNKAQLAWSEAERYKLLKHGDPESKYWMAAMSDAPLRGYNGRHEWFWELGDENHIYSLENLVDMYYRSVGHNSTLILGLTPGPDGLMPEADVKRLKEFGDEIRKRFSNPLATTGGEGDTLAIELDMERNVNTLVLREEIAVGQRVREYRLDVKINDKWKTVAKGSSIGNKRIQEIEPVTAKKFRLIITKSIKESRIKEFSLYNIRDEYSNH